MSMPPIAAMICGRWLRGSGAGMPSQPPIPPGRGEVRENSFCQIPVCPSGSMPVITPAKVCDQVADQLLRPAGDLAEADQSLIGADLHQHDLVALHAFMRGPAGLGVGHRQRMSVDFGDLHECLFLGRGGGLRTVCAGRCDG